MIGNCIYLSSGTFFALGHGYVDYEHVIYFTFGRLIWSLLISYGIIGHGISGFGKLDYNIIAYTSILVTKLCPNDYNHMTENCILRCRCLYKRFFGSSGFSRIGKVGVLHIYVPRNHSIANDRCHEDTDISELDANGKYQCETLL